jgi:hypothetical protein
MALKRALLLVKKRRERSDGGVVGRKPRSMREKSRVWVERNDQRIAEGSRDNRADVCPDNIGQSGAGIMHLDPSRTSANKLQRTIWVSLFV